LASRDAMFLAPTTKKILQHRLEPVQRLKVSSNRTPSSPTSALLYRARSKTRRAASRSLCPPPVDRRDLEPRRRLSKRFSRSVKSSLRTWSSSKTSSSPPSLTPLPTTWKRTLSNRTRLSLLLSLLRLLPPSLLPVSKKLRLSSPAQPTISRIRLSQSSTWKSCAKIRRRKSLCSRSNSTPSNKRSALTRSSWSSPRRRKHPLRKRRRRWLTTSRSRPRLTRRRRKC